MTTRGTLILAIETSTKTCSVALGENGQLIAEKEIGGDYSHAENLASFVQEVLIECNCSLDDLNAVAVGKGPGSYTGLRIGVSYAKGLCYALDIPLISIDSLKGIANGALQEVPSDAIIAPMIDARRMEVYCAFYDLDLNPLKEVTADIIDALAYKKLLDKQRIVFLGNGAEKCIPIIDHPNAIFLKGKDTSAKFLLSLAQEKYEKGSFENLAYFEPFYLKDFVAGKPKKLL